MDTVKRFRSSNFSNDEKALLVSLIHGEKNIVENKKSDSVTWRDKEAAWTRIAAKFNASAPDGNQREEKSLRKAYENIKKGTRAKTAENGVLSGFEELVMATVNPKTMVGLHNSVDSDQFELKFSDPELCSGELLMEYPMHPSAVLTSRSNSPGVVNGLEQQTAVSTSTLTSSMKPPDWGSCTPGMLKTPSSEELMNSSSMRRRAVASMPTSHMAERSNADLQKDLLVLQLREAEAKAIIAEANTITDARLGEIRVLAAEADLELRQLKVLEQKQRMGLAVNDDDDDF